MAQSDGVLTDGSGQDVLNDANTIFNALFSNNLGPGEPPNLRPGMWWADESSGLLKQRNSGNTEWINRGLLNTPNPAFAELAAENVFQQRQQIPAGISPSHAINLGQFVQSLNHLSAGFFELPDLTVVQWVTSSTVTANSGVGAMTLVSAILPNTFEIVRALCMAVLVATPQTPYRGLSGGSLPSFSSANAFFTNDSNSSPDISVKFFAVGR